jgi:predicted DCC family thiol-disulfide oxidoreductase YuxK
MLQIQTTGNFGYFNVLTSVVALLSLDYTSVLSFSASDLLPPHSGLPAAAAALASAATSTGASVDGIWGLGRMALQLLSTYWRELTFPALVLLLLLPLSVLQFIMNSWINLSWPFWSGIYRLRLPFMLKWSQWYAAVLRAVIQFRMVQAYGVFPPSTPPPQRWAVVFEGSADGVHWKRYEYNYYLSSPRTPPCFIAPFHPRLDHAVFYESFYQNGAGPATILGHNSPYTFFSSCSVWVRLQMLLLRGGDAAAKTASYFFRVNPFPDPAQPPKHVRAMACQYLQADAAHAIRTGEYWTENVMGVHIPAKSLEALQEASKPGPAARVRPVAPAAAAGTAQETLWPLSDATPQGPEDFFVENVFWRRRAGQTHGTLSRAEFDEAWEYIHALRVAALDEAMRQAKTPQTPVPTPALPSKGASSTHNVSIDLFERTHIRAPIDQKALLASIEVLDRITGADGQTSKAGSSPVAPSSLPAEDAHQVLTWSFCPGALASLRKQYSASDLVRIRRSLSMMTLPLVLMCERLFDKQPSQTVGDHLNAEAVQAATEFARSLAKAADPAELPLTTLLDVLIAGVAPDSGVPKNGPAVTSDGFPIYEYAGNDDGGMAAVPGGMRSPLHWLAHCHYLMMVGGKAAFEYAIASVVAPSSFASTLRSGAVVEDFLLGRRLPTTLAHPAAASIANASVASLMAALSVPAAAYAPSAQAGYTLPGTAPTEASLVLLMSLTYNAWATSAIAYHRLQAQSFPSTKRATAPVNRAPSFLPAFLELTPRLLVHPDLRRQFDDCGLHAGEEGTEGSFIVAPLVPRWRPTQDLSFWSFEGVHNMRPSAVSKQSQPLVVIYDGVCRLCSGLVSFLIKNDADSSRYRFCALQSDAGKRLLRAHNISDAEALKSFTVLDLGADTCYRKSTAALVLGRRISVTFAALTMVGYLVPEFLRDAVYDVVSSNRYRWFGKSDGCMMPSRNILARFLDADEIRANMKAESEARTKTAQAAPESSTPGGDHTEKIHKRRRSIGRSSE